MLAHVATCPNCKGEAADVKRLFKSITEVEPTRMVRNEDVPTGYRLGGTENSKWLVRVPPAEPAREPHAERWASLAAKIAGDRRDMHTAWLADLDGRAEDGVSLTPLQQRRYALGFLVAAIRFVLRDSLGRLWRPIDWILSTRNRRESFTGVPPALLVLYIAKHDGVHTLLTEGWGWTGGCGVAMFALVRWLQRVRGIELAEVAQPEGE
ncbi:hypothetical protein STRTUCAR8_03682 [Streptomyces turgidiscabies Car8]|uniref:Uncharacterized protein n=1 Tax=Streptomyces turgidiscabies (strain Car8) TaxID=698760 RepID=L7ES33_STRT8|nr:hypothetical protein STRTUCAR8_03682 [Streptomyces turgidiscabies Car8]